MMDLTQKVIDTIDANVPVHTWCPHCDSDINKDMIISKDGDRPQWVKMAQKVIDEVLQGVRAKLNEIE